MVHPRKKRTVLDHLGIIFHPLGLKVVSVAVPLAKFRKFWPSQVLISDELFVLVFDIIREVIGS